MDKNDYLVLLKQARENLPESTKQKSRFELPKIESFIEGNRTIIPNWKEVARQIRRDEHFAKLMARELATSYEKDKAGRLAFAGKFHNMALNKHLSDYVRQYVICNECHKPDTGLIRDGRMLILVCEACGARHSVK
ncbi:MAG: translation initiation factor IF-2 subunit beta [Candidatus Hodarchaeales archaeon]